MKILVITNLFPPHHAGTYDYRCESVVNALRGRGHLVHVLTSNHGLRAEQRGAEVDRQLILNGAYGHESITQVMDLKDIEIQNNQILRTSLDTFAPEVAYVWGMTGLSKSMLLTLARRRVPVAFSIGDRWLSDEFRTDPWLDFWNREQLPFKDKTIRASLELSGQRDKWDEQAPNRLSKAIKRLPNIFGDSTQPAPDSIQLLPLRNASFVNHSFRQATVDAGFPVADAKVIPPVVQGVTAKKGNAPSSTAARLLVYLPLREGSGAMTALEALVDLRKSSDESRMTVAGQGDTDFIARLKSFAVQNELPVEFEMLTDTVSEMGSLFGRHDLLVHTVISDEIFTMIPVQAAAAGLPVIVTRHGTVGDLFRHGENCLQAASGDAADLASRIQEMQSRADLREYFATKAREEVEARFNEHVILGQIEALLQNAIDQIH